MVRSNALVLVPQLESAGDYQMVIPKGTIVGITGTPFGGLSDYVLSVLGKVAPCPLSLDERDPELVSMVPTNGTFVDTTSNIVLTFNKNVKTTSRWSMLLVCGSTEMVIPSTQVVASGAVLSIPLSLPSYESCEGEIEANSISDLADTLFPEPIIFSFSSKDSVAPTVSMTLTPINSTTEASRISDIILVLNDQTVVTPSPSTEQAITINSQSMTQSFSSEQVAVEDNVVILPNSGRYLVGDYVTVEVPEGFFVDEYGNGNQQVSLAFRITSETVVPEPVEVPMSYVVADGSLQVRFSSVVVSSGAGKVTLRCKECEHEVVVPGTQLTAADNVLTVSYAGLRENEDYVIILDADVVYNIYGNGNAPAELEQSVNVHTSEKPALLVESCQPAGEATGVVVNTMVSLVLNQEVSYDDLCVITVRPEEAGASVTLLHATAAAMTANHTFTVSGLRYFTRYLLEVPAGCFRNSFDIANDAMGFAFRTTYETAPSVISFNQESMESVLLDAPLVFTFNQDLMIPEGASITVKAQGKPAVSRAISAVSGKTFSVYNQAANDRLESRTSYTVYIPEGTVCNSDGLCMEATTFLPFTTTAETASRLILQNTTPTPGATQVAASSQVVLHFSGPVRASSGAPAEYVIYEDMRAVAGTAEFAGQDVKLTFPLKSGKTYTYVYDDSLFASTRGAAVYYDIGSSFSFTVADTEGPECFNFAVSNMLSAELRFNENVIAGTGSLVVVNSAGAQVAGPITVTIESPSTSVTVFFNGQNLPDDVYTFQFSAGFVKDLSGNASPAFERTYNYDRVAPFVTSFVTPASATAPLTLVFSEAVTAGECSLRLEDQRMQVQEIEASSLVKKDDVTFELSPVGGVWSSGATYTLTIPATCFVDLRATPMATAKVITMEIPEIPALALNAAACQPASLSTVSVSQVFGHSVEVAFALPVEYTGKTVELVSESGCKLTTGPVTVEGAKAMIPVTEATCLSGRVVLVAPVGTFVAPSTGSQNVASTLEAPLYEFSFLATRPTPLSATAVYSVGLQVSKDSRVDITFDRAITASAAALQSLSFLSFLDLNGQSVALGSRIHGEISGATLKVVVDEALESLSAQIRYVAFRPVVPAEGIVAAEGSSDVAVGTVTLQRLFALSPASSTILVVDPATNEEQSPASLTPTYRVTFEGDVAPVQGECDALIINDGGMMDGVRVSELVAVNGSVFTYTTPVTAHLSPNSTVSVMVDNSCFARADATVLSGMSNIYTFFTEGEERGPALLGVIDPKTKQVVDSVELEDSELSLVFNKPVTVVEGGHIFFLDQTDGSVVTVTKYESQDERVVVVKLEDAPLRAKRAYQMRPEGLVVDAEGAAMEPVTKSFGVTMAARTPLTVEHISIVPLTTEKVLLTFDAARDPNLESSVSAPDYCTYKVYTTLTVMKTKTFRDVCVGLNAEPVTLAVVLDSDPESTMQVMIFVQNSLVESSSLSMANIEEDISPMPQTPATPVLNSIHSESSTESSRPVTLTMTLENSASYGLPVLSYSFVFLQDGVSHVISMDANMLSNEYTLTMPLTASPVSVVVKASSAAGSSMYSAPLQIEQPFVSTTVPPAVDASSVSYEQLFADTILVQWAAPATVEKIVGYTVTVNDATVETEEPSVRLSELPAGELVLSIVATNSEGQSAPTEVHVEVSATIAATVAQVTPGASYAVAKFTVTFRDSAVECALNAGRLIRAAADTDANYVATVVFSDLIPSFAYSGLCWAYSLHGSDVSTSIPLSFNTAAAESLGQITVSQIEASSMLEVSAMVSIDRPARVACVMVSASELLVHKDVMRLGETKEHRLGGPLRYTFPYVPSPQRIYCAAENAAGERVAEMFETEEVSVPAVLGAISLVSTSVANGAEEVSLFPTFTLTYDHPIVKGPSGRFVVMGGAESIEVPDEDVTVAGNTLQVRLPVLLRPSTRYTYFFTSESFLESKTFGGYVPRIIYGEFYFTTVAASPAPQGRVVFGEEPEDVLPAEGDGKLFVAFSDAVSLFLPTAARLTSAAGEVEIPAEQWTVRGRYLFLRSRLLMPNTQYVLTLPTCSVVSASGGCNELLTGSFATGDDAERPLVVASQPAEGQREVPNDVPLKLVFDKPVKLVNVNNVELLLNTKLQALTKRDVEVRANEVTIVLSKGFSNGNANLESIEVALTVRDGAFEDYAGNSNEAFEVHFTAVPQRCGSSYLSSYIQDDCTCTNVNNSCVCKCGKLSLFSL